MENILLPPAVIIEHGVCFEPKHRCSVCGNADIGPMYVIDIDNVKGQSCLSDDCIRILELQVTGAKVYEDRLIKVHGELMSLNTGLEFRLTASWDQN